MRTISGHDRESDLELIYQTQAYLEHRSHGHDPPPPLAAAWERFYGSYAPRLRAVIARCQMTAAEREDCFQEVWMSVVAHLGRFQPDRGRARLSTWLTTVARNKAVDMIRRQRRHWADGLCERLEDQLLAAGPDPTADYARQETQDRVRLALAELSKRVSTRSYQVLYQRRIEGRTVPEIADALDLTPDQVRLRDHRMMRRFRTLLAQSND